MGGQKQERRTIFDSSFFSLKSFGKIGETRKGDKHLETFPVCTSTIYNYIDVDILGHDLQILFQKYLLRYFDTKRRSLIEVLEVSNLVDW